MTKLTGVERLKVWVACGTPITMTAESIAAIVEVLESVEASEKRLTEMRRGLKRQWRMLGYMYALNIALLALHWWVT